MTSSPARFLFAITDGGGTVPADTSVIRALVERGHDVRVLADAVLAPDVEATGAEHIAWTTAPQRPGLGPKDAVINDWDAKTPMQAFAAARDGLMTGPAALFAADVRAELGRRPADASWPTSSSSGHRSQLRRRGCRSRCWRRT